jgi:16S rRNA (cytosine1402-N4)-methyltransferase
VSRKQKQNKPFHRGVLIGESVDFLIQDKNGVYVDATFGGGGHSKGILAALNPGGTLFAMDADPVSEVNRISDARFIFVRSNFRYLNRYLRYFKMEQIDGILADLGVSSHQVDYDARGFSFKREALLDMRMNPNASLTAKEIINTSGEEDLIRIFSEYGEVRNSKSLAKKILQARQQRELRTTGDLVSAIQPLIRGSRSRYLAQVFQAIRIKVNDEMESLKALLETGKRFLKPGGRLVVISYHSVEDRLVKNFMRLREPGHVSFEMLTKKPAFPSSEEIRRNPRARSAKLRAAQKL